MNTITVIALVIFVSSCTATYNGNSLIIKHDPSYAYPNPLYVPPHSPHGTSVRYDIRYNPLKFGFSAPVAPLTVYSVAQDYPAHHPVAAAKVPTHIIGLPTAHSVGVPAAYVQSYSPVHAQSFIGRHFEPAYHH
ncbi:uncharacterized protein LOC118186816 [Stegodyphus dumicola]|uniref:uncharacterized protein LOC118186816 n=1 Tax=Stegodyphus dumicola TaxID=202533 RepID=UPI0015A94158|nr:uncharacterized protein LOC118186816 [Stegodyphus dumicola]